MRFTSIAAGLAFAIVAMLAMGPAKAEEVQKNDAGKCWRNTSNGNWEWADCLKEKHASSKAHAKKG